MLGRPHMVVEATELEGTLVSLGFNIIDEPGLATALCNRIRYEQLQARALGLLSDAAWLILFPATIVGALSLLKDLAVSDALALTLLITAPFVVLGTYQLLFFLLADRMQPLGLPIDWLTRTLALLDGGPERPGPRIDRGLAKHHRGAERAIRSAPSSFRTRSAREWQWAHRWRAAAELGLLERRLARDDISAVEHRASLLRLCARLLLDSWPAEEPGADISIMAADTRPAISTVSRLIVAWSTGVAAVVALVALGVEALN